MRLEITTTPRETLVWAPTLAVANELRALLADAGNVVLDAELAAAGSEEEERLMSCQRMSSLRR